MTKDEVLEVALQCGADVLPKTVMYFQNADLEKFARLVAEREREACAKICDGYHFGCAREIRARSNAKVEADAPLGAVAPRTTG